MNFAAESVPRTQSGVASGFSLSIALLGVIIIPPMYGRIADVTGNYAWSWLFLTICLVLVLSVLLYVMLWERKAALVTTESKSISCQRSSFFLH